MFVNGTLRQKVWTRLVRNLTRKGAQFYLFLVLEIRLRSPKLTWKCQSQWRLQRKDIKKKFNRVYFTRSHFQAKQGSKKVSPWYNRHGWLGVKNQLSIYLRRRCNEEKIKKQRLIIYYPNIWGMFCVCQGEGGWIYLTMVSLARKLVHTQDPKTRGSNPVRKTRNKWWEFFSESIIMLCWLAVGGVLNPPVCIRTHRNDHVNDPAVHVRVRWVTDTRKDPTCTCRTG